ncbi:hypothetical protein ACFPTO_13365 [Paraburkholderia denitrificans]|uniref:Uncharacterized protein n=1 Tax=Paraburkholderia denitrificans TaxID=694025 RepID=A0ABW0J9T6_9BURK
MHLEYFFDEHVLQNASTMSVKASIHTTGSRHLQSAWQAQIRRLTIHHHPLLNAAINRSRAAKYCGPAIPCFAAASSSAVCNPGLADLNGGISV